MRDAFEAANPEIRIERLRKQNAATKKSYQKTVAFEAAHPELHVARMEKRKQYALENKDRYNAWRVNYNVEKKNQIAATRRKYNASHREERNALRNKKRKSDSSFALTDRLRCRFKKSLKTKGLRKCAKTLDLLGCTGPEAVKYLENNSRGLKIQGNHIDHRRPVHSLDLRLPSQQKMMNHYLNLQLLTPEENGRKGADFDYAEWSITDHGRELLELERGWKLLDDDGETEVVSDEDDDSDESTEDSSEDDDEGYGSSD